MTKPFVRQCKKVNLEADNIYDCLGITPNDYIFKRDYIKNPPKKCIVREGGGLQYENIDDDDLYYMYNELNVSVKNMNKIIGHKISDYLSKFKKKKALYEPKLTKDMLIDMLYNKQMTLVDIAKELGYNNSIAITTMLKKYDIDYKSKLYIKNRTEISYDSLYQKYIVENKTLLEIAKEYKSTKKTIGDLLRKYKIYKTKELRDKGRYNKTHTEKEIEVFGSKEGFYKFINDNKITNVYDFSILMNVTCSKIQNYVRKYGAYELYKDRTISHMERKWLDENGIPDDKKHRQVKILKYFVDGYDPETKTVYEFLGDLWHGNPRIFRQDALCVKTYNKMTYGELYTRTCEKIEALKNAGYNVIYIWECDYNPRVYYNKSGKSKSMLPPEEIIKNVKLKKRTKYRNIEDKYAALGEEVPHGTKIGRGKNRRYFYPEDEEIYGKIEK